MFNFKKKKYEIFAVTDGTLMKMNKVKNKIFSKKMMGDGFAIQTKGHCLYAPFDGEIIITFPSKHAVGITSTNGFEVVIYIGLETIYEDGNYFHSVVEMGQQVKKGDLLVWFNLEKLEAKGYDMTTVLVFTNPDTYKSFSIRKNREVLGGSDIAATYIK